MLRVGIVAGEASGDRLGAGLIEALRARVPDLQVEGVAGPRMRAAGCLALADAERLAVMGLVEVLDRYRELRRLRADLARHFLARRPDVFVGIDAPEFNLGLETRLRAAGIRTVQYVSPQAWAWREGRVAGIRRATDAVLTLFPFEEGWYRDRDVPAVFVGHPLASAIPSRSDRGAARTALGLAAAGPVLALLPGSRRSELAQHVKPFLETARWCAARVPGLRIAVAAVDEGAGALVRDAAARSPDLVVSVHVGRAQTVIAAADAVLTASGTATLETMLVNRPMVVAYRVAWLTWIVLRRLVRVPHVSIVNVLAGKALVPEFLQDAMAPGAMGAALLPWLRGECPDPGLQAAFDALRASLSGDADGRAAQAVLRVAGREVGQ